MKLFSHKTPRRWNSSEMAVNPHGYSLLRWRAMLPFALFLAGCATKPVTQEVKIPVYTKCVTAMPIKPTFEVQTLGPGASDGEKVLALARDTPLHFKYEGLLEAALAGCL